MGLISRVSSRTYRTMSTSLGTSVRNLTVLPNKIPSFEKGHTFHDSLMKWNLDSTLTTSTQQFEGQWPNAADESSLKKSLGNCIGQEKNISFKELNCTQLSMDFFDRFYTHDPPIVKKENGWIVKCFEETRYDICPGVLFTDAVRKALLHSDSDEYFCFSEADREEFLYKIFQFVVLGGQYNQYEDKIGPYLEVTRSLYKDLISVKKVDGGLRVMSKVYQVWVEGESGEVTFPVKIDGGVDYLHPQT